jgi:hypothetical protein
MTPLEKAKYLKRQIPKMAIRFVNQRILEFEPEFKYKELRTETKEYWEQVREMLYSL